MFHQSFVCQSPVKFYIVPIPPHKLIVTTMQSQTNTSIIMQLIRWTHKTFIHNADSLRSIFQWNSSDAHGIKCTTMNTKRENHRNKWQVALYTCDLFVYSECQIAHSAPHHSQLNCTNFTLVHTMCLHTYSISYVQLMSWCCYVSEHLSFSS